MLSQPPDNLYSNDRECPATPKGTRGIYVEVTSDVGPLVTLWRLPIEFANDADDPIFWKKETMPMLLAGIDVISNPDNGVKWARARIDFGIWHDHVGMSGGGFAAERSDIMKTWAQSGGWINDEIVNGNWPDPDGYEGAK